MVRRVTKKTDEFIAAARGYINSVQDKETAEHYTSHYSRSCPQKDQVSVNDT